MRYFTRHLWMVPLLSLSACFYATSYETTESVAVTPAVSELVVGKVVTLADGGSGAKLSYFADGRYSHQDASSSSQGRYSIDGNRVCVTFSANDIRCDTYLQRDGRYYFVNRDGQAFPVVDVQPI